MDFELLAKIIGGIASIIVAWKAIDNYSARRRNVENLKLSVELFKDLPDDFESKKHVEQHIKDEISRLYDPVEVTKHERVQANFVFIWLAITLFIITGILIYYKSLWAIISGFFTYIIASSTIETILEHSEDQEEH